MREAADGSPEVGPTARTLGVRPGVDVRADTKGHVGPGAGGLSVAPRTPLSLPRHRLPSQFGGIGRDLVWRISRDQLGVLLNYRPDPLNSEGHGYVEPAAPMPIEHYEAALVATKSAWQLVRGSGEQQ
jgi:hypothetical protein